jgi:hypothetical protein
MLSLLTHGSFDYSRIVSQSIASYTTPTFYEQLTRHTGSQHRGLTGSFTGSYRIETKFRSVISHTIISII